MSGEAVRKRRKRLGLAGSETKLTPEQQVTVDISRIDKKEEGKAQGRRYKAALDKIAELERNISVYEKTKDIQTHTIRSSQSGSGSEATAVVLASDWHWGETVLSEQTNGLNEFNPSIRAKRAEKFFSNVVRLIHIFDKDITIHNLVLALLGDFISNNIHDELMESNSDLPIDEIISVQETIASGIEYILANTKVNLVIPTASGNHGRTTKKTHFSTEAGNSLEYLMYHNLARHFANSKRVKFILSRSYLTYVDVAGYIIRFHHGHALKFAGGIGGLFIPAYKAISQWNKGRKADLDCFCHFHQVKDGGIFLSNGSLVGFNDFAVRIKADYEKAKQVFFLVDHKRREKTVTCPVFLE